MSKAAEDANTYRQAARLVREDPLLRGSTLILPDYGQVVVTGDLHGHRRNFERIRNYCDLEHAPVRHVILHELIHEEPEGLDDHDMSHEVLLEAARWKVQFPEQVHFLQSNHELAQLIDQDISKGGRIVTFSFLSGVRRTYGDDYQQVVDAMMDLVASYPLAARTANRIMIAHSLPDQGAMQFFDPAVLDRLPTLEELRDGGSAYRMVWGRYHTAAQLEDLSRLLDADIFICGHQPQETGHEVVHGKLMILASDHNHGVILPFDLKKPYGMASLERALRPLASIA